MPVAGGAEGDLLLMRHATSIRQAREYSILTSRTKTTKLSQAYWVDVSLRYPLQISYFLNTVDCMSNEGLSRAPRLPTLFRRVGRSFLLGFILFVFGTALQGLLRRESLTGISLYIDDLILGILAGLVVFAYEQRRYREIRDKIAMIAAMNHHVRNALQAISYAPYTEQAKQIQLIQQSVNRIQWALREVLPGVNDTPYSPSETKNESTPK